MHTEKMTGKTIYEETKRLKAERQLRQELQWRNNLDERDTAKDREQHYENLSERLVSALEKLADRLPIKST